MKKTFDLWMYSHPTLKKLIMELKIAFLIILVSVSNALAIPTYSQVAKVSLDMKNTSLEKVMDEIESQSEFYFIFNQKQIDVNRVVDIQEDNKLITDILPELFKGTNVNYLIFDKKILLTTDPLENSLLAFESGIGSQQKQITGTVTAKDGSPIPGVNIVITGTTHGAITDIDGKYTIEVPQGSKSLTFSFIGMEPQEISIGTLIQINVTLSESAIGLNEVVVVGYGTQKKSDLTGTITSIKSETLKDLPVKSLAEAIQGQAAGVYVTKGSGEPGVGSDIIIRGAGSINGLAPLYIVDGVASGTGNNFNMSDVESIEILKDASSAAIYGVEAAGGVILVTTKHGKSGEKMHVDFNAYYGSRSAVNLPSLLNSADYIKARKVLGVDNASWDNSTLNTNWISEVYQPATEQKYDLSLSGGNEKSTYYISAGYLKEDGIRRNNWFERYNLRMNSDHKLSDNFTIGQYLYLSKTKNNPVGDTYGIPYRSIPLMAVYDPTRVGGWAAVPDGFQGGNPVGDAEVHVYNNNDWNIEGNFFADWKIIKGLDLRATGSGSMNGSDNSNFNLLYDYGILKNDIPKLEKYLSRNELIKGDLVLTFDRTFGKHDIKAMVGWEGAKSNGTDIDASASGFPVYPMPSFNTSTQNVNNRYATADYGVGTSLSQFGRLNYNYAEKYLLQATVRRDGTNKFIGKNQYGIFPSVSAAWKISEESFLKDKIDWLSNLKIRAGWGVLGSIGSVGDFIYQSAYQSYNVTSYDGVNAVTGWAISNFANSDIRWEKVTTKNLGFDFGFLKNKLSLAVEIYDKQTSDMIYTIALPPSSGQGYYNGGGYGATINIGKISNRGLEFEGVWKDKIGEFSYSVGANASFNKNKVIQIGDKGALIYQGGATWLSSSISRTEDGYPMGQFYGYKVDGIFKTDADAAASAQPNAKAGDLIYRDINGFDANGNLTGKPDGKIDDADKTYIGNPWPKCYYGINISVAFKGFDLKAFFQGQAGVDLFNATKGIRDNFYADWNTTSEIFNTSNFGNNVITNLPSVYQTSSTGEILPDPNGNYKNVSSFFVENGSYLKLKDLQLGYTLPANVSKRIGLSLVRIYLEASNLFTITKYTGLDPELGGGVTGRGIETDGMYPTTRFISLGLNLSF